MHMMEGPTAAMGLGFLFLLAGCTIPPKYEIMVTGYLDGQEQPPFHPGACFHVLADWKTPNPLLDRKVEERIYHAIEEWGFRRGSLEAADYCLRFRYGSEAGRVVRWRLVPDFWPPYRGYPDGYGYGWGWGWYEPGFYTVYPEVVYLHHLTVLVSPRGSEEERTIWVGEAISRSPSPDLRTALAVMLEALFRHFGEDTEKGVEVTVRLKGPESYLLR